MGPLIFGFFEQNFRLSNGLIENYLGKTRFNRSYMTKFLLVVFIFNCPNYSKFSQMYAAITFKLRSKLRLGDSQVRIL